MSVLTMTYAAEGQGIALAAAGAGVPVVLSFTVETDGRLPEGTPLRDAVTTIDADMVRMGAVGANASRMSHSELDAAEELDSGDPLELATGYGRLRDLLPDLTVFGGCCGTDVRHLRAITAVVSA